MAGSSTLAAAATGSAVAATGIGYERIVRGLDRTSKAAHMRIAGVQAHPVGVAGCAPPRRVVTALFPTCGPSRDGPHMDPALASAIAKRAHLGQTDRFGRRI